jgi:hypothetical protein
MNTATQVRTRMQHNHQCGKCGTPLTLKSGEKVICWDFNGRGHELVQIDSDRNVLRSRWVK